MHAMWLKGMLACENWVIYTKSGCGDQLTSRMGASRTSNTGLVSCRFTSEEVIYIGVENKPHHTPLLCHWAVRTHQSALWRVNVIELEPIKHAWRTCPQIKTSCIRAVFWYEKGCST